MRVTALLAGIAMFGGCQAGSSGPLFGDHEALTAAKKKECAVYFAVVARLASESVSANGDIVGDCPADYNIGADIAARYPPPEVDQQFASALFRKMISRGVPAVIAGEVANSNAFADWLIAEKECGKAGQFYAF